MRGRPGDRGRPCATMIRATVLVATDRTGNRPPSLDAARNLRKLGLMPRLNQGHVIERPWSDGKTISYGAKVRAYGRYEKVTFGTNKQGWNRTRAEARTKRIIQQIERGTWVATAPRAARTVSSRRCRRSAFG